VTIDGNISPFVGALANERLPPERGFRCKFSKRFIGLQDLLVFVPLILLGFSVRYSGRHDIGVNATNRQI
tara:strand:- start:259 stop:468 length:210 start_codon:yes stop_codon:yes gene_type:complete